MILFEELSPKKNIHVQAQKIVSTKVEIALHSEHRRNGLTSIITSQVRDFHIFIFMSGKFNLSFKGLNLDINQIISRINTHPLNPQIK